MGVEPISPAAAGAYLTWGDPDKPFHRPECECPACEGWRRAAGRPTRAELRAAAGEPPGADPAGGG